MDSSDSCHHVKWVLLIQRVALHTFLVPQMLAHVTTMTKFLFKKLKSLTIIWQMYVVGACNREMISNQMLMDRLNTSIELNLVLEFVIIL